MKFPDIDGFRHPVVLYDGLKNLLLIPVLLMIRRAKPPRGVIVAHFILWYGFLRIFVDFFREYRTDFLGFPPGQEFNIIMTLTGLTMLVYFHRAAGRKKPDISPAEIHHGAASQPSRIGWYKKAAFIFLLTLPIIIPSDWTQDVPARYSSRHPGISYSAIYPRINQAGIEVITNDVNEQEHKKTVRMISKVKSSIQSKPAHHSYPAVCRLPANEPPSLECRCPQTFLNPVNDNFEKESS